MKRTHWAWTLWGTAVAAWSLLNGCNESAPTNSKNNLDEDASESRLILKVTDVDGRSIPFATIYVNNSIQTTNALGDLVLTHLPAGRLIGRLEAEGFAPASVVAQLSNGAQTIHEVKLLRRAAPIVFRAEDGGTLEGPGGVRIMIPANALVHEDGTAVHGLASMSITPLNLEKDLRLVPAPLVGISAADDAQVGLDAEFLAHIHLAQDGRRLRLAAGKTATIAFEISPEIAAKQAMGDVAGLWRLDENVGVWRHERAGAMQSSTGPKGGRSRVALVHEFGWVGAVEPWTEKNCFRVKVLSSAGQPQSNVQLWGIGSSYKGFSFPAVTDATGQACVNIKRGGTAYIYAGSVYETLVPPLLVTGTGPASECGGIGSSCANATLVVPPAVCVPGSNQACAYTGPAGTENVGPCHAGSQTCGPTGTTWFPCTGEVTPIPETCTTPTDDNCDGIIPPLDDNNECTADSCNASTGLIVHTPLPLGTACSGAGMTCNGAGICGQCAQATDCPGVDDACKTRSCTNGLCGFVNAANGTSCNDGNPCTTNEVCNAGACSGGAAVVCPATSMCNVGACNPASGCTTVPKADGLTCNDFSACTQVDTCQSGVCVGSMGCPLGASCVNNACVAGACTGTLGLSGLPQWNTTGYAPKWTVAEDFNGDGKLDFATITSSQYNSGPYSLGVALGQGGGAFGPLTNSSGMTRLRSLAAGDFNGDGLLDLVGIGDIPPADVFLLINQGNGLFGSPIVVYSGAYLYALATADMTGDGRTDILFSDSLTSGPGRIIVLANQGNNQFQIGTTLSLGDTAVRQRAADVNGDGKLDIVFTRNVSKTVSITYQQPNGTFSTPYDYALEASYGEIGAADFNGDGKLDLVIAHNAGFTVCINQGNGVLALTPYHYPSSALAPYVVETTDIDSDGDTDLLLPSTDGGLYVYKNQGNGTFSASGVYAAGGYPTAAKAADLNNDGWPDVLVENHNVGTVTVSMNQGNGVFENPYSMYPAGQYPGAVAVADLSADGKPDIAVPNSATTTVSVLLNDGMGGVLPAVTKTVGTYPKGITLSDVDGNGQADILTANSGSNNVSVLLNQGNATFAAAVNYGVGSSPVSVTTADMTGDGYLDLAVLNQNSNSVSVLWNQGNGSFGSPTHYLAGSSPVAVAAGDMTGDGKADLAIANDLNKELSVLLNQGNGSFTPAVAYTVGTNPAAVAIGDLNNDGRADIVVSNRTSRDVSVLLNNGNGTFAVPVQYVISSLGATGPDSMGLADMNGDGKLDIVVSGRYANNAIVLLNQSNGTFAPRKSYPIGWAPTSIALTDMNGDDRPDVVMASDSTHSVDVFFNKCLP